MSRPRAAAVRAASPELCLRKATLARSSGARAKYAQRGLSHDGRLDDSTRMMLLRQLYLSQMEGRHFAEALEVAEQMITCNVMPDVARQDAARACLGLGDEQGAIQHLRLASRVSPPARRAFHLWTLGSVLYLHDKPRDAIGALERATRWGTTDKPLYVAQSLLARIAAGETVESLDKAREVLEEAACGQGYGQFVLGELAFADKDFEAARRHLTTFVRRTTGGRVALEVALAAEIQRARRLLRLLRGRAKTSAP